MGCHSMQINCWHLIIVLSYVAIDEKYHVNEEMEKDGNVKKKKKKGHLNVQDTCRQLIRKATKVSD
jgi:hypothetical protein